MYAARVKDTSTTTGTGSLTVSNSAPTGFETFNTAFGTGATATFIYFATDGTDWEFGEGHLSSSTVLVRDTIYASSNSDAAVSWAAGTKTITNSWGRGARIDVFTASGTGTWTMRAGAMRVAAFLIGTGGPAGSGRCGASNANRSGGGGGGGGGASYWEWDAAVIRGVSSSVTVEIGAVGTGGAGVTPTANGNPGSANPNDTTFGQWLRAGAGKLGAGGTATTAAGGAGGIGNIGTGGAGGTAPGSGAAGVVGGAGVGMGAGGGASGSGRTSGDASSAGGIGGAGAAMRGTVPTGGAAGTGSTAGATGGAVTTNEPAGGAGGGGGSSSGTGNGLNGGVGGTYGGGGGGGAATTTTTTSGSGAAGALGIAVIITGF